MDCVVAPSMLQIDKFWYVKPNSSTTPSSCLTFVRLPVPLLSISIPYLSTIYLLGGANPGGGPPGGKVGGGKPPNPGGGGPVELN
jgi:hypothetical protein